MRIFELFAHAYFGAISYFPEFSYFPPLLMPKEGEEKFTQEIYPRFFTILTFLRHFLENNTQVVSDKSHEAIRKISWHSHEAIPFPRHIVP